MSQKYFKGVNFEKIVNNWKIVENHCVALRNAKDAAARRGQAKNESTMSKLISLLDNQMIRHTRVIALVAFKETEREKERERETIRHCVAAAKRVK